MLFAQVIVDDGLGRLSPEETDKLLVSWPTTGDIVFDQVCMLMCVLERCGWVRSSRDALTTGKGAALAKHYNYKTAKMLCVWKAWDGAKTLACCS
jgi:hypothetical protein